MNRLKTFALLMGTMVMVVATSCGKQDEEPQGGDAAPGKKIHRVYISYDDSQKYLSEEWHWSSNKLESIDYFVVEDGEVVPDRKEKFTFDGNHVSRVELESQNEYYANYSPSIYEYTGDKLTKVSYSTGGADYNGNPWTKNYEYNFYYQNDTLSRFVIKVNNIVKGWYRLMWTGNNLTSGVEPQGDEVGIYEYDSMKNPFYGHFGYNPMCSFSNFGDVGDSYLFNFDQEVYVSENNVTALHWISGSNYNFEYFYDEDCYPIKMIRTKGAHLFYKYYEYE